MKRSSQIWATFDANKTNWFEVYKKIKIKKQKQNKSKFFYNRMSILFSLLVVIIRHENNNKLLFEKIVKALNWNERISQKQIIIIVVIQRSLRPKIRVFKQVNFDYFQQETITQL